MRKGFSLVALGRGVAGVAMLLAIWEAFARSGMFSTAMTPPIESVGRVLWTMLADGSQPHQLTNSGHNESPNWSAR